MICEGCAHRNVCQYIEKYKEAYMKINEVLENINSNDLFVWEIRCKQFMKPQIAPRAEL